MVNEIGAVDAAGETLGAIVFIAIAYMVGRWQMNKAGATIDATFADYAQEVSGICILFSGVFGKEMAPDSVLPDLAIFIGTLQIIMDLMTNEKVTAVFGNGPDSSSVAVAGN